MGVSRILSKGIIYWRECAKQYFKSLIQQNLREEFLVELVYTLAVINDLESSHHKTRNVGLVSAS